ncbi:uncharacterized protein PAC_15153 [Phialocephala subalpina]|uniref:C2H2-type domain-containing protein n=1 Tax=Phialocephala subalpina TaxID=576137 RepID=A0A1L7XJR8_9HELO|nr:uncharacterized protein PAC_15153 [Phialocephala subalpina]
MLGRLRSAGKIQHNQSQGRVVDIESSESEENLYVPGEGQKSENDENFSAADDPIEVESIVNTLAKDDSAANVDSTSDASAEGHLNLRSLKRSAHCAERLHSASRTCADCDDKYSDSDVYIQHYLKLHSKIWPSTFDWKDDTLLSQRRLETSQDGDSKLMSANTPSQVVALETCQDGDSKLMSGNTPISQVVAFAFRKAKLEPHSEQGIFELIKGDYRNPSKDSLVRRITQFLRKQASPYEREGNTTLWAVKQNMEGEVELEAKSIGRSGPRPTIPKLIEMAIEDGPKTLDEMFRWISTRYPLYAGSRKSIRDGVRDSKVERRGKLYILSDGIKRKRGLAVPTLQTKKMRTNVIQGIHPTFLMIFLEPLPPPEPKGKISRGRISLPKRSESLQVPTATLHSQDLTQPSTSNSCLRPDAFADLLQAHDSLAHEANLPSKGCPRQSIKRRQVPMWIVTRAPRFLQDRWSDGSIEGKSLATFIEQLLIATKRSGINDIILELRTPKGDTRYTVREYAEDQWIEAKETFAEELKLAKRNIKSDGFNPAVKILVEPIYGDSPPEAEFDDSEEFTF